MKVRLTVDEKTRFEEAAKIAGISLSAWMRERLRRAAVRELEDASRTIPFIHMDARINEWKQVQVREHGYRAALLRQGRLIVPPNQRHTHGRTATSEIFFRISTGFTYNDDDYFLGTVVLVQAEHESPS